MKNIFYRIVVEPQPTETSCGPSCLNGIYNYLGLHKEQAQTIQSIEELSGGGTLGVQLGIDAIKQGFNVQIYTHNLYIFDPTWFSEHTPLKEKLHLQMQCKSEPKILTASQNYIKFLELGGRIKFEKLTPLFLYRLLKEVGPVICGVSGTYLYKCPREINETCKDDDVCGYPQGHFVVLNGVSGSLKYVDIVDPFQNNPLGKGQRYKLEVNDFIHALLIGVITYDANIITIRRK